MKIKTSLSVLVALAAFAQLSASANAQPRPAPPVGQRPVVPAPPVAARPLPPVGQRPDDRHLDDHRADDRHDAREAAAIAHQETEEQIRLRLQQHQDAEVARRQAERRNLKEWNAKREQRALEARNELASTWGTALNRPDARAELNKHADRMARLNRILDVAQDKGDAALVARTRAVMQREIARDTRVMQGIRAQAGAQ